MKDKRPGRSTRIVLMLTFTSLLALLLATGWQAIAMLDHMHQQESLARTDYLARNACLMKFDTKLTVYGQLVQRPHSPAAAALPQLSSQLGAELQSYPESRAPEEQALLNKLAIALKNQNTIVSDGASTEALPGHLRVIAATEEISLWNHDRFRGADSALLASFDQLRANLRSLLSVFLGSGLLLAVGSMIYIAGQEREARQRYTELMESRDSHERLSARLLDAQEEERRSISRELHDEVGQSLGALLVDVGRLSAMLPPGNQALQEHVMGIRTVAERSVNAVRNISLLLRPSMLDDLGLTAALEWQGREVSRRSQMEVDVKSGEIPNNLTEEQKICIYRVVQEALNNAARHSGAQNAWVTARTAPGNLAIEIRDNGHGFDPARTRGLGLLGMEERVRRLRGSLKVISNLGGGTTVTAELPTA